MPCRSDYMEARPMEREAALILDILHELNTGEVKNTDVYASDAYNRTDKSRLDSLTRGLCSRLRDLSIKEVLALSDRAFAWYVNHLRGDVRRALEDLERLKEE